MNNNQIDDKEGALTACDWLVKYLKGDIETGTENDALIMVEVIQTVLYSQPDRPDREVIMFLISLGFTHKIENGFHVVEGHGFKYSHVGILNIAHRIKQTFFERQPRNTPPLEVLAHALDAMKQGKKCLNGQTQYYLWDNDDRTIRTLLEVAISQYADKE